MNMTLDDYLAQQGWNSGMFQDNLGIGYGYNKDSPYAANSIDWADPASFPALDDYRNGNHDLSIQDLQTLYYESLTGNDAIGLPGAKAIADPMQGYVYVNPHYLNTTLAGTQSANGEQTYYKDLSQIKVDENGKLITPESNWANLSQQGDPAFRNFATLLALAGGVGALGNYLTTGSVPGLFSGAAGEAGAAAGEAGAAAAGEAGSSFLSPDWLSQGLNTGGTGFNASGMFGPVGASSPGIGLPSTAGWWGAGTGITPALTTTIGATVPSFLPGSANTPLPPGSPPVDPTLPATSTIGKQLIDGAGKVIDKIGPLGAIGGIVGGIGGLLEPTSGTDTTTKDIPDWLKPYMGDYLNKAQALSNTPQDPLQKQAYNMAGNTGQQDYQAASNWLQGLLGGNVGNPFTFNPYLEQSIADAKRGVTENYRDAILPSMNASYSRQGAFGGSAYNEMLGKQADALNKNLGEIETSMRNADFNRSSQLYENNLQRQLAGVGMSPSIGNQGWSNVQNQYNLGQQNALWPATTLGILGNAVGVGTGSGAGSVSQPWQTSGFANTLGGLIGGAKLGNELSGFWDNIWKG